MLFITALCSASLRGETRGVKFKADITPLTVIAKQSFRIDLKSLLSDLGQGNLQWATFADKPAFVTLNSAASEMTGTPALGDIGTKIFRLGVQDGDSGAITQVQMKIITVPEWSENPIDLKTQKEDEFWQFDLKSKVIDPLGNALTFSVEDASKLPTWMTLNSNGILSGTPRRKDIGAYSGIVFIATTQTGGTAKASAFGAVVKVVKPPKWVANPITINNANEDFPYSLDIAQYVNNFEQTALRFKVIQGGPSNWVQLTTSGSLFGTPKAADVGPVTLKVEVSTTIDGQNYRAETELRFAVIHTNHPPLWTQDPVVLEDALTKTAYFADLVPFVRDPDGDKLTFRFAENSGPKWASLTESGLLSGTPTNGDIGQNEWTILVSDGEFAPRALIRVRVNNRAPYWNSKPVVLENGKEDSLYTQSLATFATDPDNDALSFRLISGPPWATVTATGIFSGTPKAEAVGNNAFIVAVTDNLSGEDQVEVRVLVEHTNHAPTWKQNPIDLGKTKENAVFNASVASFATDPDTNDTLTFTKVSGPTWLSVESTGQLSGTPRRSDLGVNEFVVRVKDQAGLSAEVTVRIEVERVNTPPVWTQDPIALPLATEDSLFTHAIAEFAMDKDNDPLTFSRVSGPAWLQISTDGKLGGTPRQADIGEFSAKFAVSDGKASAEVTVTGKVVMKNMPPGIKPEAMSFIVKERQTFRVNLNQPQYVQDPNGDPLTFELTEDVSWIVLHENGELVVTPQFPQIGNHTFTVRVSDGKLNTEGFLRVTVVRDPRAPVWLEDPIAFNAKARVPFKASVADKAQDLDGLPLTFSKKSGPAWLTVDANGALSGTPSDTDVGTGKFVLTVKNDVLGTDATVNISVLFNNHEPYWTQNPVLLSKALAGVPYTADVSPFGKDPDVNDTLTYTKVSGPTWLSVDAKGGITGTPTKQDIGKNTFEMKITDPGGLSAVATIVIPVEKPNTPPRWTQDPLALVNGLEDTAYAFDISKFAVDDDGDPLSFKMITGPAWLTTGLDGRLGGTPAKADVGEFSAIFEVSDGKASVQVGAKGTVIEKNLPPVVKVDALVFNVKERQVFTESLNQEKYVSDPNGDRLTFTLVQPVEWVTLKSTGELTLKPLYAHIGSYQLPIKVSDGTVAVDAMLRITVARDPRAPVWLEDPIGFQAKARVPFQGSVSDKAKDLDGIPITFSKKSGPAWLSVDANGNLSGTPADTDVGAGNFILTVTNDVLGSDATVVVTVQFNNHDPYWTQNPVILPKGLSGNAYTQSLVDFAKDPDPKDTLTFTKVSGPAWLTLSTKGLITGTPTKTDVGNNTFVVKVTDPTGASAEATVHIEIEKPNTPPRWTQDPLTLPDGIEDSAYAFDVSPFAVDADNDPLAFKLVSGPAWMSIGLDGRIFGTPRKANLGEFTVVFEVSDGKVSVPVNAKGKVVAKNLPPVVNNEALQFTLKERQVFTVALNQPKYVSDPNGDPLTFTLVDGPAWLTVKENGDLTAKPLYPQIGNHSFVVKVSDGKLISDATLRIIVVRDPRPPVWLEDPITFQAKARQPFSGSIADKAQDLDGLAVTFTKKSGPSWLTIDSAGALSGTPTDTDLGANTFVVTVKNDLLGADATVIINVTATNHDPYWTQNPVVLPKTVVGATYVESVAPFAVDPDPKDVLTITKVSGPNWLNVGTKGEVSGVPTKADIGKNTFRVKVTDPAGAFAETTVTILVEKANTPPRWTQDPILLSDATEQTAYAFDISPFAIDADNDPLAFKLVSGPAWMTVGLDGRIFGTPPEASVGEYSAIFEVSDGKAAVQVGGKGKVLAKNLPPIVNNPAIQFTVKERQTFEVSLNQPKYVSDPNGDPLAFTLVDTAEWVTLSLTGDLVLKPLFAQIGEHAFRFKVSDGKLISDGTIKVNVLRDPRPPVWLEDPINLTGMIKVPLTANIADKAKDLDGIQLTFSKIEGADWLTVNADGTLTGTPPSLGEHAFKVRAKNDQLGADAALLITVTPNNKPPYWTANPVGLPNAEPAKTYAQSVSGYAVDPEGEALTFAKVSGPKWAFVTTSGLVIGNPAISDKGINTLVVKVADPLGASAETTVRIQVGSDANRPPRWLQDPIPLGDLTIDVAFNFNLAPLAVDDDGDVLRFRLVNGPEWLRVTESGMLQGTPRKKDLGAFTAILEVSDGVATAQAGAMGTVKDSGNKPPVIGAIAFTVKEREILTVNLNQSQYVSDPDGDPLTFELPQAVDWIKLSATGSLELAPKHPQIGTHAFPVRVTDDKGHASNGTLNIKVIRDPRAPQWLENPIRLTAKVNEPFVSTLADKAKDPDGLPLAFSKVSGPTWLTIASDGAMSGTPKNEHLGENGFVVTVRNDALGAEAQLIITVTQDAPQVDTVQVDKAVPGAPSENLWVIDNSWPWLGTNRLVRALKEGVHYYYDALNAAGVRHTGIYLSSDVHRFKGLPIQGDDTSPFISWKDGSLISHFVSRVNDTYSKKCNTSPIWAMFKFYEQAPSLSDIYHQGYFTEGSPMDVLVVTKHADAYKSYAKGTSQANMTPADYADRFIQFHQNEKQSYRISAIASECQNLLDPDDESVEQTAQSNPYRVLVNKTNGQYFTYDCHFDMEKTMKDYADRVIFRAYVNAKKRIPLSKVPANPATIEVRLGGKLLTGVWTYDASKNEIEIQWHKIDISALKAGDLIEIKYKTQN